MYHVQIGLYSRVVTYFLRYLCVALNTITPSLIERAYKWLSITWFGSGKSVGSHETGVSLFSITCKRCGGKIGGPEIFCQGTDEGIS